MKTKSILQGLTLAVVMLGASAWQAPAQIYSSNVVGYYLVPLTAGWSLLANQFVAMAPATYNANWVIHPWPEENADGALLYRFNPANQNYYDAATYFAGFGWYPASGDTNDPALNLPLGEGFFIWTPHAWTAVFVGEVPEGTLINPLPAKYSLKASMVPQAGALTSDLAFPPIDGAEAYFFRSATQKYTDAFTYFDGYGWFDPNGVEGTGGPISQVGDSFFLHNPGPETVWLRNFTVSFVGTGKAGREAVGSASSTISRMSVMDGMVRLNVLNPKGAAYAVQFSSDGVSWATIAANQTGTSWEEPLRAGARGYYQLINP